MKKILYSTIFGSTDDLKEPKKVTPGWDYVLYTDDRTLKSDIWDIRVVESGDPRKTSRYYKTHPPEADLTIWLDATFQIKGDLDRFALSKTEGIWLNSHPQRQCAYEEMEIIMSKELDKKEVIDNNILRYRAEGFPEQFGLWRCGIIVRPGRNPLVQKFNETWWKEIEQGSWRDQPSFAYTSWKLGITPNSILHGITNIYFRQSLHKPQPTDTWKFVGEGDYDPSLTERYQGSHLIILKNGLLFPSWISNYIPMKHGQERFIELIQILGGVIVRG